jgi:hypothetical protein
MMFFKNLTGYVGLPPGHKLFKATVDQLDRKIQVHGGVTFAGRYSVKTLKQAGAHAWAKALSKNWFVGFDCGQLGDLQPGLRQLQRLGHETYRTIDYVTKELHELVHQIERLTVPPR